MGMISDNDAIFNEIDKLKNDGKFEEILEKIKGVSEEEISNKLWFEKIEALNMLGRFDETKKEIRLLMKRCSEPEDDAKLYYYLGYTFEHSGCGLKAIECYKKAKEFNPQFENIQGIIDNCKANVKSEFENVKDAFEKLISEVDSAMAEVKKPEKLTYPEALTYISMIESSFLPEGLGVELPLDNPFFRCKDEETKEKLAYYLEKKYGITDLGSLQQWYGDNRLAPIIQEVRKNVAKKIPMPVDRMSPADISYFESIMMSLEGLEKFLPKEGVLAWDFNMIIALSRLAFAAGIISNTDFCEATLFFTDECKKNFSSWKEFAHSVIIGGYFNALFETQYDVESAILFGTVASKICKENYPSVKWIK